MSNQEHMTIEEAVRFLQDGAQEEKLDPRMFRAARTIVSQAEQIERLQEGLYKADKWGGEVLNNLIETDIIYQEDMQ